MRACRWPVAAAAVIAVAGCSGARGPVPVRDSMLSHFELAADLRASALVGDLAGVRRAADGLVHLERPPDLGPEHAPGLLPLARAARDAERAESVDEAARATARVARACGDCHAAYRVGLEDRLFVGRAPTSGGVEGHMQELSRASGLLWNGVAGPSERLWSAGAAALAGAGPLPAQLPRELPAGYVNEAAVRLLQLGRDATTAEGPEERDRVLAEIWATCADCHSRAGVG